MSDTINLNIEQPVEDINLNITEVIEEVNLNIHDGSVSFVSGGEANTMSSLGGTSLVGTKTGVNLPVKGIIAGTNVSFGVSGTAITINASGSAYTAGDGMTLDGTEFNLGGTYTDSIAITTTDGSKDFEISNTDSGAELHKIVLNGTGVTVSSLEGDYNSILATTNGVLGSATMQAVNAANSTTIQVSPSYGAKLTDTLFSKGFVGAADYSANYDSLTYVQKVYADAKLGGKNLDTTVTNPGAGQDGHVLSWDQTNGYYELIAGGGGTGTEIEDSSTTTGLYTEETANRLVGHSAGTGTDIIYEMFEGSGTPVSVFQIAGNGDLLYNGVYIYKHAATTSVYIGTYSSHSYAGGSTLHNTFVGYLSGGYITTGDGNNAVGRNALGKITSGSNNTAFGSSSGIANQIGNANVYMGHTSGYNHTASNCIFLGKSAGFRQTTASDLLLINNYTIASSAAELTDSIIYGLMSTTVGNQLLRINAKFELTQIPSGATQVGAGAGVNEVWKTASHATLPDNVLMIGV